MTGTTRTTQTPPAGPTTSPAGERAHTVLDSPIGPLTLVAEDGALTALLMEVNRHGPRNPDRGRRHDAVFGAAAEQLQAYFAGELTEFDLPLAPEGTAFQQRVWEALRQIPYGETRSYGQIATSLGTPGASRAVGLANGHNPISIVVPCHRVIGADGSLTGYGGGLERNQYLLDHERRVRGDLLF
jgi:methylated-DNA-[protein]-cysteine S-methyltransferase